MSLKEALNKISKENREYFKYKFPDVRFDKSIEPKTEEQLLKITSRKTINGFIEWEKSSEYATLVALYLQSKMINDIHAIYQVVREKALTGDDKQVKLLLTLNKEINIMVKASLSVQDTENDDDGLVL
ncbi:hypothetical protein J7J00_17790 [Bacillus sp. ISL-4]|uniref:hypothetical protein n=1 Tax=Bacillus sp. ISL-4 TaxID=2819125 RepID=UPI001BE9CFDE|nr:hypothetical protein [Bacillus sp. ISL-4]MBT2667332.1 hypothetical protein [Bacillus sp. ISL-4]MBT2669432.1 hypothetical protein [Streptomyces sp. ISL-14]